MQLGPSSSITGGPTVVTGQSAQFAVPSGGYAPLKIFKHDELPKPLQRAQGPHAPSTPSYLYGISCSESFLFDYVKQHDIYVKDGILYEISRVVQAIQETMQEEFKCPFITIYPLEASEPTNLKFGIAAYTNQEMFAPEWLKRIGKTSVEEVISKIQEATGIHDEPMWHPDIGVSPQDVAGF